MSLRVVLGFLLCLCGSSLRTSQKRLKLIGAGHQRTGTESLTAALLILGFNPSHGTRLMIKKPFKDPFTGAMHRVPKLQNVSALAEEGVSFLERSATETETETALGSYPLEMFNMTVLDSFMAYANGTSSIEPALQTIFDNGFDSTTPDVPTYGLTKELIDRFPEAKVIMTVHPRGSMAWADSMTNLCWGCQTGFDWWSSQFAGKFSKCIEDLARDGDKMNQTQREACAAEYDAQNEEITDLVPPEQLLVYSVADGWGPLCKFLGVPVPKREFPHVSTFGTRRRHGPSKAQRDAAAKAAASGH